ncbi:unnamed protein product [Prorocentrum cordatum]|uniref:Uncharacterized protein n=1 Tax=Prorocentrum cordatum TaxID=2364126 RepID=A0ABN9UPT2_9DINO|nr:unnamed protein product [Polarella glacialis]
MVAQRDLLPAPLRAASATLESSSLDALAAPRRGRRRRTVQNASVSSWTLECLAVNWLGGKEGSPDFDPLSLWQRAGVLDLRNRLAPLGPPPVSSAAALGGPCRSAPGCLGRPAKPATFAVDSVALPLDGVKRKPGERLADAACTIAPFHVAKSDGRRRLALDTRKAFSHFNDPATAELPTAGVWGGLRTRESDELVVEQVDIEAAFYRVGAPEGLSDFMVLPSAPASDLAQIDPSPPAGGAAGSGPLPDCSRCRWAGLGLSVAPARASKAGFREKDMISDKHAVKDVPISPAVAAHADGAAVIGVNRQQARGGISAVKRELEVRLSSGRLQKMRLALLELASQEYVSGRAVPQLAGHYNWAAPLMRAGGDARRLWPDAASELRAAGALLGLAFLNTRRPIDPVATGAGASTGDGDPEGTLFGGFGFTERPWPSEAVWDAARRSERWRYLVAGAAAAREHTFSSQLAAGFEQVNHDLDDDDPHRAPIGSREERAPDAPTTDRATQGDFAGLAASLVFPLGAWTSALFGRWARPENIPGLEAARWLPSKWNSSDKGARIVAPPAGRFELDPRGAGKASAAFERATLEGAKRLDCHEFDPGGKRKYNRFGIQNNLGESGAEAWGRIAYDGSDDGFDVESFHAPRGGRGAAGAGAPSLSDRNVRNLRTAGKARQAPLKAERAKLRALAADGMAEAADSGPTHLQHTRPKGATRRIYLTMVTPFLTWANLEPLKLIAPDRLDLLLAHYLGHLCWERGLGETGSRLSAAIQHYRPDLPKAKFGGPPQARAALRGFRRRGFAGSFDPIPKPMMFAMIGGSILTQDLEFAAALAISWDAMLRLPSDALAMAPETPAGPGRGAHPKWALLLYPREVATRSKTLGCDEGVVLRSVLWQQEGASFLAKLRAARRPMEPLWSFTPNTFKIKFAQYFMLVGYDENVIPYQVRHRTASHAVAIDRVPLAEAQSILRHSDPQSVARYAKEVRYLSLLNRVPEWMACFTEEVEAKLGQLLLKQIVLKTQRELRARLARAVPNITDPGALWINVKYLSPPLLRQRDRATEPRGGGEAPAPGRLVAAASLSGDGWRWRRWALAHRTVARAQVIGAPPQLRSCAGLASAAPPPPPQAPPEQAPAAAAGAEQEAREEGVAIDAIQDFVETLLKIDQQALTRSVFEAVDGEFRALVRSRDQEQTAKRAKLAEARKQRFLDKVELLLHRRLSGTIHDGDRAMLLERLQPCHAQIDTALAASTTPCGGLPTTATGRSPPWTARLYRRPPPPR